MLSRTNDSGSNNAAPRAFRALRHRDFRLYWSGQIVSQIGNWMQIVAQGWLVYRLTTSPFMLGLVTVIGLLPVVPVSLIAGVICDRLPRRTLIIITECVLMLQALTMAILSWHNLTQVWHIAVLSFVLGAAASLEQPARLAFVADIAGPDDLTSAVALSTSVYSIARIIGPALAGAAIAWISETGCFLLNAVSYVPIILALLAIKEQRPSAEKRNLVLAASVADGLAYIRRTRPILVLLVTVAVTSFFGLPYITLLPVFASDVLDIGAQGLGWMTTLTGIGAVGGALAVAGVGVGRREQWLIMGTLLGAACLILFCLSDDIVASLLLIVLIGAGNAIRNTLANSLIQLGVESRYHGRVMSVYNLLFNGMSRAGALGVGALANLTGVAWAVGLGALVALIWGLVLLSNWKRGKMSLESLAKAPGVPFTDDIRRSMRHLPPVAVRIRTRDFHLGLAALRQPEYAVDRLREHLMEETRSNVCHLVSSGRAALTVILQSLRRVSKRQYVIIPAYGCPTVAQAVWAAGLEPIFCDVSPETLDLKRRAVQDCLSNEILAIVAVHLYGLAQDIRDLIDMAHRNNILIIEDAAQAYGARIGGRMVGTWGDLGLYSLGRGKCLPAGRGGVIVSQDNFADLLAAEIRTSVGAAPHRDIASLVRLLGYSIATHPSGWWYVVRSPLNPVDAGMNIGKLPHITLKHLSPTVAGIGESLLDRVAENQAQQRINARRLLDTLGPHRLINPPHVAGEAEPVFLRLPVVMDTEQHTQQLYSTLHRQGLGVSRSYRRSLPELFAQTSGNPPHTRYPGADRLARCLLTFPTHTYVDEQDLDRLSMYLHNLT